MLRNCPQGWHVQSHRVPEPGATPSPRTNLAAESATADSPWRTCSACRSHLAAEDAPWRPSRWGVLQFTDVPGRHPFPALPIPHAMLKTISQLSCATTFIWRPSWYRGAAVVRRVSFWMSCDSRLIVLWSTCRCDAIDEFSRDFLQKELTTLSFCVNKEWIGRLFSRHIRSRNRWRRNGGIYRCCAAMLRVGCPIAT